MASTSTETLDSSLCSSRRDALIVCDMQPDMLRSITPPGKRQALLELVRTCIHVSHSSKWALIYSGLQFSKNYESLDSNHVIYGALKRLYDKTKSVSWFAEGNKSSGVEPSLILDESNAIQLWRQGHTPPMKELLAVLKSENVTHVTLVGIKASFSIQIMCQMLCDVASVQQVSVVRECIQDDNEDRLNAVLNHLIPIYASVISLKDMIDSAIGLETYSYDENIGSSGVNFFCSVGRGGHGPLYMKRLLLQQDWYEYPQQEWYNNDNIFSSQAKQYYCPLGKRVVDLCDEPQFSKVSTFVKGREWLDEKEKVYSLASDVMPPTWFLNASGTLIETQPMVDMLDSDKNGPFFLKECDRNGGRAVECFATLSECRDAVSTNASRGNDETITHVVQQHVSNPRLIRNSHKCHLKFYSLVLQQSNGKWKLYTNRDAYLSVSPNEWSPQDLTSETQITIKRHKRLRLTPDSKVDGWSLEKCQAVVSTVVSRSIQQGRLSSRMQSNSSEIKPQFEIFSTDLIMDTNDKVWLIEFNFSPVLFDPEINQDLTTIGLKSYMELYKLHGKDAVVNDGPMMKDALALVVTDKLPQGTQWEDVAM